MNALPHVPLAAQPCGPLRTVADVEAFEILPLAQRLPCTTTYAVLAHAAGLFGDRDGLLSLRDATGDLVDRISFCALFARVTQAANLFHALGANSDDGIAFLLPNLIDTHVVLWGAQAAGIVCPINPFLAADQIASIAGAAQARVLVVESPSRDPGMWEKIAGVSRLLPSLRAVVLVGSTPEEVARLQPDMSVPVILLEQAERYSSDGLDSGRQIDAQDVAAYFHTGGTTGVPKLACLTHGNLSCMAWLLGAGTTAAAGERIFCGLPLFHVNGAMITGLNPFLYGQTVVLLTPRGYRDPAIVPSLWKLVERFRPYALSAVPTVYAALVNVDPAGNDIGSLRHAISGAAPLPPEVLRRFEALTGVAIAEGYGLTESSCVTTGNPLEGEKRAGSVGIRLPYTGLRISRDGGRTEMPAGETGSVLLSGPHIFKGYRESATPPLNTEGWFDTGDLGRLDEDGYLWLTGRAKDIIIRGGHNIDPATIEDALAQHPDVMLAAAIGRPDRYAGELPVAVVTLKPNASPTPQSLLDHARATISERAAVPVEISIVAQMPMTAVGKIYKLPLRHRAIEAAFRQALSEAGIAAEVHAEEVPGRGAIASVRLDAAHREAAITLLAEFSVAHRVLVYDLEEGT